MSTRKSNYYEYELNEKGPLGRLIKAIIIRGQQFIVYLDEDDVIQWSTEGYGKFDKDFGDIQNKISFWESVANRLFTKSEAFDYKCLLAEAYARILDDRNSKLANQIIERTVNRMQKQGREILKQNYLLSTFISTAIVMIITLILVCCKRYLLQLITSDTYEILIVSLFGGIGAFVFTTIRIKKYSPDIILSKQLHRIDGSMRIFYGMVLGLIVSIGIKSNVVLSFINQLDKTIYLKAFLGIIAGASEVFIPNLIKQVESKSAKDE